MIDAVGQINRRSFLDETHVRLGATIIERDGLSVPESYGDVPAEYATVRDGGAGVIDLSNRGRLLVSGSEAVQFLNGLITNDMKTLAEHSWMPAAFPNVQGRLNACVRVVHLKTYQTGKKASATFLIDTEAATYERVLKTIERFTLAGDFHVRDVSSETAMLSVQGAKAAELVKTVLGEAAAALAPYQMTRLERPRLEADSDDERGEGRGGTEEMQRDLEGVIAMRATHTAEDGFDLVVNAAHAAALWQELQTAGARPVGHQALEILRIEAGSPRFGVDMDDTNVVTEVLEDAVSYTKGCYVGQEIIARIKYRGHVAKKLSGIAFDRVAKVAAGVAIKSVDDKEVGRVTSVTESPRLGRTIALGVLKFDYLAAGTKLKVVAGDEELPAQVTELPFVRGSWYSD